ncbi:MAG: pyridoxal-phosphate dependent enzyme [bacterium]|nr:pyridoxal-phosphate dependent enzyme [bacterium]
MAARTRDWKRFTHIDIEAAARRIDGVLERTPLMDIEADPRIQLRAKLENRQKTGAFKARGAWNNISQLTIAECEKGVVACSSGNHGRALAWAARRAEVKATIVMPKDAYPNKIAACREEGAQVVLMRTRQLAEDEAAALVAEGWTLVHPYDRAGTIEGAGTVGLEIAADWPEVEVVVVPVGGGGLLAGSSLALRRALGDRVTVIAVEPEGAPTMKLALEAGEPVTVEEITTNVQGLCPLDAGKQNVEVCRETVDDVLLVDDDTIYAAQARLVDAGEIVEPAGAAACAAVFDGRLPAELLAGRGPDNPLRVCVVVSGGNPDPEQLESVRSTG